MFKSIIKTATFRQSSITFAGTLLNGLLGALFYIIVFRLLGPSNFGIVTISIVTLTLIADVVDIGTNTGLIRFVSSNLASNKDKAMRFLKLSLEIKLIVWAISFLIIFILSSTLANTVFHNPALTMPLRLVAFGVGSALLFSFATSALQAYQKYFLWSGINIITNLFRLILILFFGYLLILNIESSLLIYIVLPLFGFFLSLLILPTRKILSARGEFSLSKELFSYNIPVALFAVIAAFSSRLDTYLTANLLNIREVGIYGVATQTAQVIPQLVSAIGVVAAPKFASFQSNKQMLTYLIKLQLFVSGLCILGILVIPTISYLIPVIYGVSAQQAVTPFIFIFLAMLIFLFSIPVHNSVIFYFSRPDIFIWVSLGHLILIGGLGYFMISSYGVLGASLTVLVGTIFNFLSPLIWLLIKLKKNE